MNQLVGTGFLKSLAVLAFCQIDDFQFSVRSANRQEIVRVFLGIGNPCHRVHAVLQSVSPNFGKARQCLTLPVVIHFVDGPSRLQIGQIQNRDGSVGNGRRHQSIRIPVQVIDFPVSFDGQHGLPGSLLGSDFHNMNLPVLSPVGAILQARNRRSSPGQGTSRPFRGHRKDGLPSCYVVIRRVVNHKAVVFTNSRKPLAIVTPRIG
mmetsp:Transcript_9552/g.19786  ORF Transcript_9552/g.19786 Transcript_9552/m.19786 type:complete len:206 (-) Transcript_9552:670-1287(-)